MRSFAFSDSALARRLERAESAANASFVEARARFMPAVGAMWIDVDGTWAMFDGVGSPCTQTFGFGLFSTPRDDQLDAIESFFSSRQSGVMHEVSPLADPSTLSLLGARGYLPIEASSVMHRPIDAAIVGPSTPDVRVRVITPDEVAMWASASVRGWGDFPELGDFMRDIGTVMGRSRNTACFVAEIDGVVAATAALSTHEDVALLTGASTIPDYRGRGAQNALLQARIAYAASVGCDLAQMVAQPGGSSQRNAERQGFRIAYTRMKWGKK
ncbi:MAG: GNAT family N-acetyltransferase [Gemmatimonas sp.]